MKNENKLEYAAALASVGLTAEQLALREASKDRLEREARWAEAVRKQQMRPTTVCQAVVYRSGSYHGQYHGQQCSKTARVHRDEPLEHALGGFQPPTITRHYCGTHDPVAQKEKLDRKYAAERAERDQKYAATRRSMALSKLACNLSIEQLEEIVKVNPTCLLAVYEDLGKEF